jgi:hypothetical protein
MLNVCISLGVHIEEKNHQLNKNEVGSSCESICNYNSNVQGHCKVTVCGTGVGLQSWVYSQVCLHLTSTSSM